MAGTQFGDEHGARMAHVGPDRYRMSYGDGHGSQHLNSEGASHMKPTMPRVEPTRDPVPDLAVHPGQGTLDLGQLRHAPGDLARAGHHLGVLRDRVDPKRQSRAASDWTSPMEGQTVIPMTRHLDMDHPQEIDAHGNHFHPGVHPGFGMGPQMSHGNAYLWNRYGTNKDISATTPITTAQSAHETGDTSYIRGELHGSAMRVGIVNGEAHAFDGHHRTQQLRGRGETSLPVRHLDIDALTKKHGSWQGALVAHGFSYDGRDINRQPGLEHELTPEQIKAPAPRGTYASLHDVGDDPRTPLSGSQFK